MSNNCQSLKIRTIPHTHLTGDIINFVPAVCAIAVQSISSFFDGLTSNEIRFTTWAQTYSANYEYTYNTVLNNSAFWSSVYTTVNQNSAAWNSPSSDVSALTANWQLAYNNIINNSASYLSSPDITYIASLSSGWENTRNTVLGNSSIWNLTGIQVEVDPVFTTWAQIFSAKYESTYNTVNQNSSTTWNYQGNDIKPLTANWQLAFTNLLANSAAYLTSTDITFIQGLSSGWQESYLNLISNSAAYLTSPDLTEIQANSAEWELVETIVKANSAEWALSGIQFETDPVFTTWGQTYSSNYQSTYVTVAMNSANWTGGGGGDPNVNMFVYVNSAAILETNSVVQNNSAGWELIESIVQSNSAEWALSGIQFETDPIFTAWAQTYSGNYQSSYNTLLSNSAFWASVYNTVNQNSAINWNYQGTDIKVLTASWELAYNNIISNSAAYLTSTDISYIQSLSAGWESTKNIVSQNSATTWNYQGTDLKVLTSTWQSAFTNLTSNSAAYLTSPDLSLIRSLSASWENTKSTVSSNSAQWAISGIQVETDPVFTAWAQTFSANYQSTYNTVNQNSAVTWNYQGTDLKALSSRWELAFTNIINNSAAYLTSPDLSLIRSLSSSWENTKSTVSANSASWINPSLSAYVTGPVSSIDNNLVLFDGISGKTVKDSGLEFNTLKTQFSTGILSGGILTTDVDVTKYNISNGYGLFVDTWTDISNTFLRKVTLSGLSGLTTPYLSTSTFTHVYVNSSGQVVQFNTVPTPDKFRDYIYIGQVSHTSLTSINAVISNPVPVYSPILDIQDIQRAIGFVNTGNIITANGANLQLNKSSGTLEYFGINYSINSKIPNVKTYNASTAFSFRHRTQTGNGAISTILDIGNYDSGGTITAMPGNRAQNFRVFLTVAGNIVIQYGQTIYNTLTDAIAGLQAESFTIYPNLEENATLIAIISVESNATALNDTTRCKFLRVSKFGETVGANAGISVATLQSAYNNAVEPEIVTDSTRGALNIRRGSTADTDKIFVIENGGGFETVGFTGSGTANFSNNVSSNTNFYTPSGNSIQWNTTYSVVRSNSAQWAISGIQVETDPIFTSWAQTYSARFISTTSTVSSLSSNWNTAFTYSTVYSTNSAKYESVYTTVNSNSSTWGSGGGGGSGNVVGPASSVNQTIPVFDGATGKLLAQSNFRALSATLTTQANAQILLNHTGTTDSYIVLTPQAAGGVILGPRPDGSTGGDARGQYSFDAQLSRSNPNRVAAGYGSFTAGTNNRASGSYAVAIGLNNMSTSNNCTTIGAENTADWSYNSVIGYGCYATQPYSIAMGLFSRADRWGMWSWAGGAFNSFGYGEAQTAIFVLRNKTTNNTPTRLFLSDSGPTYLTIPSGKVMSFIINLVGIKSDGSDVSRYIRTGVIKNVSGTTSLVGTVETIGTDIETNASTDVSVTANDTADCLDVTVTGITSETWRWAAEVIVTEVAYGT